MATQDQLETFSHVFAETGDLGAVIDAVTSSRPPARACSPFLRRVCECLDVSPARILSADRSAGIAADRHLAMWVVRQSTGASYPELGLAFGGMHHTSVMSACRRVERTPELLAKARSILATLSGCIHQEEREVA